MMKPWGITLALCILFVLVFSSQGLAYDMSVGGNITVLNITPFNDSSDSWGGYYGDLLVDNNPITGWLMLSDLSLALNTTERDFTIECSKVSGYLLISNESTLPVIGSLAAGNLANLDAITGTGSDSATNTFTTTSTFTIAGNTINNVPTVYPYVNSGSQSSVFRQGFLEDGNALIFVAEIDQDTIGYDGNRHDFQFMIPFEPGDEYYIFALFSCESYCGDGVCMGSEDCDSCPEDCGECPEEGEEEPQSPQVFILTPPTQLVLYPVEDIKMRIELEKDLVYLGEPIEGTVIIDYWGSQNIDTFVILELNGVAFLRVPITLEAPITHLEIPFKNTALSTGHINIQSSLEGFVEILGKTMAEAELMAVGPQATVCPLGDDSCQAVTRYEKCELLGIDCIIWIIILALITLFLFFLIAGKRHKKKHPKAGMMDWLWAAKYNIEKR